MDWDFDDATVAAVINELKTHPNVPYYPMSEGGTELIPKELQ